MHFLTKASLTQCKKLDPNLNIEYFFGNLAFLLEKFYLALTHYLKAASLIKSEKFYKRLCYSLMKSDAMFEGIILLQLLDRSYNFETVKQIIPKIYMNPILFGFIFDINLLELLIELNSHNNLTKSSLVTYIQYSLIDSPTRHQSLSSSNLPTQLLDQFLDLLHFTMTYLKS